jgi:hypothetical protein
MLEEFLKDLHQQRNNMAARPWPPGAAPPSVRCYLNNLERTWSRQFIVDLETEWIDHTQGTINNRYSMIKIPKNLDPDTPVITVVHSLTEPAFQCAQWPGTVFFILGVAVGREVWLDWAAESPEHRLHLTLLYGHHQ